MNEGNTKHNTDMNIEHKIYSSMYYIDSVLL